MRHVLQTLLLSLIVLPALTFAMPVGSYFQQGVVIENSSGQAIIAADATAPSLQNEVIQAGYQLKVSFPSDQLTNPAGQQFSHTISIHSANNFDLICTVQSNIELGPNGMSMHKPTSTNEARCTTSNMMSSSGNGMVLATLITVK